MPKARYSALLLSTAAIAVAGCGGSSKPSPATSSGVSTSGATNGSTTGSAGLGPSTSLSTAAAEAFLRHKIASGDPNLLATQAQSAVRCLVAKLKTQGITNFGQAASNQAKLRTDTEQCIHAAGG